MNDKRSWEAGSTASPVDRSRQGGPFRLLIATFIAFGLMASSLAVAGAEPTDSERRDQLQTALADIDARIADANESLSGLDSELADLTAERDETDDARSTTATRLDESDLSIERLDADRASLDNDLDETADRRMAIDSELAALATERLGPAAVRDEFAILLYTTGDPRLSSIMDEVVTGNAHLDDAHDRTIFTMVFGASMERLSAVDAEIAAAIDRQSAADERRDELQLARSEVAGAIADEQVTNAAISKRLELLTLEIGRLDRARSDIEERSGETRTLLSDLSAERQKLRTELDEVDQRLEQVRAAELAASQELERKQREAERLAQERAAAEAAARTTTAEQAAPSTTIAQTTSGSLPPAALGSTSNQTSTTGKISATVPPTATTASTAIAGPGAAIIGSGTADPEPDDVDPGSIPTGATRGAGRGVLTGLGSGPNRAALAVKIDNSPRARPQTGINQADVVFEELVEGGLTRLVAVFHSTDPSSVGPIRSGRTSDIHILGNLSRPLLAFSGANPGVLQEFADSSLTLAGTNQAGSAYSRNSSRRAPHNLYASTSRLRAVAGAGVPRALFDYRPTGAAAPSTAQAADGVSIAFGAVRVDYAWDGAGWARSTAGKAHSDSAGVRVAPENVVVRFSNYRPSQVDARSPEVIFSGSGSVWVFTAGKVIQGTWSQAHDGAPATYTDRAGRPIQLTPGRTWVALAEPGTARLG